MEEPEKFYGKLWRMADSIVITIPSNVVKFGGYAEGDEVTCLIKKKVD